MKTFVIFFALFCATVAAEIERDSPLESAVRGTVEQCLEILSPSQEAVELLAMGMGAGNREVDCLYACMYKTSNLMANGKFRLDTFEGLLRSGGQSEQETQQILNGVRQCKARAEVSGDECDVAGRITECTKGMN